MPAPRHRAPSTSRRSTAATRGTAVRDAEERAAAAQHLARSAAERDVSTRCTDVSLQRAARARPTASSAATDPARARCSSCVAGITKPTTRHGHGRRARSRRSSSSGAGFHPEISGRENVFINGIMLGLTKREITRRFDEIVDFAELRGLHRRAGEDLLVGHVHAPRLRGGDPRRSRTCCWSTKCWRSATRASRTSASTSSREFRRRGKTILLVTHSLGLVERFCDEALWLDDGHGRGARRSASASSAPTSPTSSGARSSCSRRRRARASAGRRGARAGEPPAAAAADQAAAPATRRTNMFRATEGRWGSREVEITERRVPRRRRPAGARVPVAASR